MSGGVGFDAWPKLRLAKEIKSYTFYCYVRCAALILRVGGMPWLQTGTTQYHTQIASERPTDRKETDDGLF